MGGAGGADEAGHPGGDRLLRACFAASLLLFGVVFAIGLGYAAIVWHELPFGSMLHLSKSRELRSAGDVEGAIRELESDQRINAQDVTGAKSLAKLLEDVGRPGSLEVLESAAADSFDPEVHFSYARKLVRLGRMDEADDALARAVVAARGEAWAWELAGELQEQALRKTEAEAAFRQAREGDPGSERARQGLARIGAASPTSMRSTP